MALPSSNRGNRVSVVAQAPQINLADYTPNPAAIPAALSQGIQLGQQVGDALTIRPRQVQAGIAQANLARDTAKAQGSLLEQQTRNTSQVLDTQNVKNNTDDIFAALTNTLAKRPEFQADFKNELANTLATKAKVSETGLIQAAGENRRADTEEQIKTDDSLIRRATSADTRAVQTSPETSQLRQGAIRDANLTAAGTAAVGAAPFFNPGVRKATVAGAEDVAATNALAARQGLIRQAQTPQGGTPPLSNETREKIYQDASKEGVQITNPDGSLKQLGQISAERQQRANLNDPAAQKILEKVREDGDQAQKLNATFQKVQTILQANPLTGGIFTGDIRNPVNFVDSLLAMTGNPGAQARDQLQQAQSELVLAATNGRLGSGISDADSRLLVNAGPSISRSDKANRNLLVMGLESSKRGIERPAFYETLTPLVGANGADSVWRQYAQSNPLADHAASTSQNIVLNKTGLTPDQYLSAVRNPAQAVADLAPKTPEQLAAVPIVAAPAPGQPLLVTPTEPYVLVQDANGATQLSPNPLYWNPIREFNARIPATPPPAQAQQNQQGLIRAMSAPVTDFLPRAR